MQLNTTGKTIITAHKGSAATLIKLDRKQAKQYNHRNDCYHYDSNDNHFNSFRGIRDYRRGVRPAANTQTHYNKKFTQNILIKAFAIPLICATLSTANPLEPKNFIAPSAQSQNNQNQDTQDLQANEFYLNLEPNEIKSIQQKDKQIRESFDKFSEKEINYKPQIRPLSSMDSISLHPYFTFSILLPQGAVIKHIDSSVKMPVLKFENNAILVRPDSNFTTANLTILYQLKDKNQILNLLATFYEKGAELDKLNLIYAYKDTPRLSDLEVIQAYIKAHNAYPSQTYNYIQIDDITYRIVEDSTYGTAFVRGKKYRVDNATIYK